MPNATRYGSSELQVRSVNRDKRTIDFIASTFAIDSYGTRIDQSGWQFSKKTPITWAHDDRGSTPSGGRPIARGINLRVENGQLKGTAEFPKKGIFQFADEIYELAADGFIPATSVGFQPIEEEMSMENGQQVPIYRKARLLEIAFVTIPSNDEAQIDARTRMLNRDSDIEDVQLRLKNLEEMATQLDERAKADDKDDEEDAKDGGSDEEEEDKKKEKANDNVEDADSHNNVEDSDDEKRSENLSIKERMTDEYLEKCVSYFENKQAANRASTKVLKRFFQARGVDLPEVEEEAWSQMGTQLDSILSEVELLRSKVARDDGDDEEEKEDKSHNNVEDADSHGNVEDSRSVTNQPPIVPAQEAPGHARKASVQLPLPVLLSFKGSFKRAADEAVAEALRQGVPMSEMGGLIDSLGTSLRESLSHS